MYHEMLDSLDTAVMFVDMAGQIHYMNPAGGELFAVSTRRIQGTPISTLLPEIAKQIAQHPEPLRLTLHDVEVLRADHKQLRLNCSLTPLDQPIMGWILELLPKAKFERVTQEEALWAQYEASTLLARTLAHEIKNPLAGISGSAQLLARQLTHPSQQEFVDVIIRETSRLSGLLDRMLGGNQPAHWVTHNIHAVLEQVASVVRGQLPAHIQLIKDYDPSIPEFTIDFDRLVQVFLNLVRNAIQAIKQEKGQVTIKTRIQSKVTLGNHLHPLVVCVEIIDTGEGIPAELMEAIFLPMITNKPDGTGLGLPIAQSVVHQHGGMILVESQPQHTVFRVYLPLKRA